MNSQKFFRAWLVVGLLLFTSVLNYGVRLLPTTMHGSIVAAIPMTETQFGLLSSVFLWSYGLMSPFAGFLADRFNRSRVIITSLFAWSVITWLTSYTRTFEQLLFLRSLMGISEACYLPAAVALISDYHEGPTRSLATGIHQIGGAIGTGLSGLGGWIAERRSWHYTFSLVGLIGIAYAVLLVFLLRDAPRESPSEITKAEAKSKVRVSEALVSLFGCGSFVLALVIIAMSNVTGSPVFGWMPVFLQEHFHLTQGVAGISATGYMNAAAVPGLLIGGAWADQWSRTNGRARMFVAAIGLVVSSTGILLTANTNVFVLAMIGLVIYRLFLAFAESNLMPSVCDVVDPRYRATGFGLLNLMSSTAAGFGIYFSGLLRDLKIDLQYAFDIGAAGCVICAIMFYLMKPRRT